LAFSFWPGPLTADFSRMSADLAANRSKRTESVFSFSVFIGSFQCYQWQGFVSALIRAKFAVKDF